MKKKLLLVLTLLSGTVAYGQAPTLSRTGYHIVFYDEFDYPDKTSPTPVSTIGTTAGQTFYTNWSDDDPVWGGTTYYNSGSVYFPSTGIIRLTESDVAAHGVAVPVSSTRTCDHWAGKIDGKRYFDFGILEAKIKFPRNRDVLGNALTGDQRSTSAFWTCCGGNEIDIFDAALNTDWLPVRVWDWYYVNHSIYPDQYNVTQNCNGPFPTSSGDLSDAFHTYSALWEPSGIAYYLDDNLIGYIPYTLVRLYPEYYFLQLAIMPITGSIRGQSLDIDWVKVWRKECANDKLFLPDISHTPFDRLEPGLHRHRAISSSSSSLIRARLNNATILEAESITLDGNFIADASVPLWGPVPAVPTATPAYLQIPLNYNGHDVFSNGYFLAQPSPCSYCDLEAIAGPDIICATDIIYYFSNSTPGGRWATDNPSVTIDPITGIISGIPISGGPGLVTIYYWVGDCYVAKTVRIIACEERVGQSGGYNKSAGNNTNSHDANSLAFEQLEIYPNPTNNEITIFSNKVSSGTLELSIKDISGRSILTENVQLNENTILKYTIDIHDYTPGVYFVDITFNGEHTVKKIVKL